MLLGYISIAYPQIRIAKQEIKAIKSRYNYNEELKWTNVHDATYRVYSDLIECIVLPKIRQVVNTLN
jgi:hypothetical protein